MRRACAVAAMMASAILTPPDVISQMVMLIPLVVLYFVSIGLAYLIHLSRRKKEEDQSSGTS